MIKYALFDLDGTLLPMDQDVFIQGYFKGLATRLAPGGYDPKALIDAVWAGTVAMIKNGGTATNEEVFWSCFESMMGAGKRADEPLFDAYYREDFPKVRELCGFAPAAARCIHELHGMGVKTVLATNPIFPAVATMQRIKWAGLSAGDFELVTTYENSRHSKPNPDYYRDVLDAVGAKAEESVMIGNDVGDDMPAAKLGMKVFLLTDCLINRKDEDISAYPRGSFPQLMEYIKANLA